MMPGIICPKCGKENGPIRDDCWNCGETFSKEVKPRNPVASKPMEIEDLEEKAVMALILQGLSNGEIAHRLGISTLHVSVLKDQLEKKFEVNDRDDLLKAVQKETETWPDTPDLYINALSKVHSEAMAKEEKQQQEQKGSQAFLILF